MTYQEMWNFIVTEYQKLYNEKEEVIDRRWRQYCSEILGFAVLFDEIKTQVSIHVGVHDHAIPDILLTIDGKTVFDIELKKYCYPFDIRFEKQLISYFNLTHIDVGMIICQQIVLYSYDYLNNSIKKIFIPFEKNSKKGIKLIELLQKRSFVNSAIHSFVESELAQAEHISEIKEQLRKADSVNDLVLNFEEIYSQDEIAQAISEFEEERNVNPIKSIKPANIIVSNNKSGHSDSQICRTDDYIILDVNDDIRFHSIYKAINAVAGTDYKGWMKACWPSAYGSDSTNFRIWFPKLAERKDGKEVAASFDCLNMLSEDWNEIVYDDLKERDFAENPRYEGYDLIFAKEPNGGDYIFRGVFIRNKEKSHLNHHVESRIATKVKVIGKPAHTIELLNGLKNQ